VSDSDRIASLEAVVRNLARRVSELEAVLDSRSDSMVEAATGPAPEDIAYSSVQIRESEGAPGGPPPFRDFQREERRPVADTTLNLEGLIGRYGTLALATLTILAAVGSFLAWAIARGLFGPWMRIGFGTLFAGALAFVGLRLRLRNERRFGNVLLSLALAALHVVAWALGPGLHLVPLGAALAVAAVASAALCVFAIRESDDDLLAVGFGGAYIAPFVTGDGSRAPDVWLATYGTLVFGAGVLATNGRPSRMTFRVISAGLLLFALTLLYAPDVNGNPSLLSPLLTLAGSLVVMIIGRRVAWRGFLRVTLTSLAAVSLVIATRYSPSTAFANSPQLLAIVIAGLIIWASTFAFPPETPGEAVLGSPPPFALLDYTVLPLLLLAAAVSSLPPGNNERTAALCALWAAVTGWLAHRSRTAVFFEFFAVAACAALAAAPLAMWWDNPEVCIPLLAVVATGLGYAATRYRPRIPLAAAAIVLSVAFIWSLSWFSGLDPYTSLPFSTRRSVAVGATVAAAFLIVRWNRQSLPEIAIAAPWIAAFLWGDVELGRAFSPDVSAFLLVAYFAASGVAVLSVGTKRGRPRLRQIGLGLAVIAGLKALFEAGAAGSILAKLGIYLVAGAYLMIVAYMYRRVQPKQSGLS
jgi:hypothetical protein